VNSSEPLALQRISDVNEILNIECASHDYEIRFLKNQTDPFKREVLPLEAQTVAERNGSHRHQCGNCFLTVDAVDLSSMDLSFVFGQVMHFAGERGLASR